MPAPDFSSNRFSIVYFFLAILGIWLFQTLIYQPMLDRQREVTYNEFRQHLEEEDISEITLSANRIDFKTKDGDFHYAVPVEDPGLVDALLKSEITFKAEATPSGPFALG